LHFGVSQKADLDFRIDLRSVPSLAAGESRGAGLRLAALYDVRAAAKFVADCFLGGERPLLVG